MRTQRRDLQCIAVLSMPMVPKHMRRKAKIVNVRTLDSDQNLKSHSDEGAGSNTHSESDCKPHGGLDLKPASDSNLTQLLELPSVNTAKCQCSIALLQILSSRSRHSILSCPQHQSITFAVPSVVVAV